MNKQKMLKVLNPLLGLDIAALAGSVALRNILPPDFYPTVHPVLGVLLFLLAGTHVVLNWAWIRQNYLKKAK